MDWKLVKVGTSPGCTVYNLLQDSEWINQICVPNGSPYPPFHFALEQSTALRVDLDEGEVIRVKIRPKPRKLKWNNLPFREVPEDEPR